MSTRAVVAPHRAGRSLPRRAQAWFTDAALFTALVLAVVIALTIAAAWAVVAGTAVHHLVVAPLQDWTLGRSYALGAALVLAPTLIGQWYCARARRKGQSEACSSVALVDLFGLQMALRPADFLRSTAAGLLAPLLPLMTVVRPDAPLSAGGPIGVALLVAVSVSAAILAFFAGRFVALPEQNTLGGI